MSKFLKIVLCITLGMTLSFSFSSCEDSYTEEYYGDYHDGYVDGYNDGVVEGQKELGYYTRERFSDARGYTYGVEESLTILTLYADGESFSEEEIFHAIQIVSLFYDEVCDVIYDVENYYDN